MRFCKSCGSIVAGDDEFCVICGAKIDEKPEKNADEEIKNVENLPAENESQINNSTENGNGSKTDDINETKSESSDNIQPRNPLEENGEDSEDEYIDISSFAPVESKKEKKSAKKVKVRTAPIPSKNFETKVVGSRSDIEAKTREVGSINNSDKYYKETDTEESRDISSSSKKKPSKRMKAAIILGCTVLVLVVGIAAAVLIMNSSTPSAEELYALGQQKYKSEDYYGAITDLSECVEINSSNVEAYMLLADAYIATGQEEAAESALEIGYRETGSTTIKSRLDALSEKLRLDKVYNSLVDEGNSAVKNKDYNLAITKFTAAIESRPEYAEPYILAAEVYISQEEYDKALTCLKSGEDKVTVEKDKLEQKISEVSGTITKIEEEERKRLEEESRKAEEESRKAEEERQKLIKQPVEFETKIDEKTVDYKDTNVFRSEARWVVFNNDRNLAGIDYANKLVENTLSSYYEFDPTLFGVKDEKELYVLVKASRDIAAITHCRVTVTYNKNGILSFVIYKYYVPPTILGFKETVEAHTINIETGDEYDLNNILADPDNVENIVKTQAELINVEINDQRISNMSYFLSGDSLIFYMKNTDWQYTEIPLPYSDKEKFAFEIEEDTDTSYLSLQ